MWESTPILETHILPQTLHGKAREQGSSPEGSCSVAIKSFSSRSHLSLACSADDKNFPGGNVEVAASDSFRVFSARYTESFFKPFKRILFKYVTFSCVHLINRTRIWTSWKCNFSKTGSPSLVAIFALTHMIIPSRSGRQIRIALLGIPYLSNDVFLIRRRFSHRLL